MFYRLSPLFLLMLSVVSIAETPTKSLTVVELFTSQGCYSCPPADEYLGELDEQEQIITLSCHVTYWNYLGWKDTFSRPFCNNRQRQYQGVLKGGERGVYTPQMVINGRYGAVGSRRSKVKAIIAADHQYETAVANIAMSIKKTVDGATLTVQLPDANSTSTTAAKTIKQQLFLFGTTGKHLLPIASGENGGKNLAYINPVEYVENKGEWDGKAKSVSWLLPKELSTTLSKEAAIKDWVVVAQQWPLGEIIAAGTISSGIISSGTIASISESK